MAVFAESFAKGWERLSPNLRAIIWITLGTITFAFNDVVVKTLGKRLDPFELAFFRYATGMIILSPIFFRVGVTGLRTQRLRLHGLRLVIAAAAQVGVLISVIHLPLATATALSFSRILFTTLLAALFLREFVNGRRWTATFIGFAGVLIMVRPGAEGIDPVALISVGAALTFAVANILIRVLSSTEPPIRILFYYHLGGMVLFAAPAYLVWISPIGIEWLLVAAIGALTTFGMTCYVRSFAIGEASVIGPMEYVRLIYAAILGLAIFGEVPDPWTIAGALIIVASSSYIARIEARAARRR